MSPGLIAAALVGLAVLVLVVAPLLRPEAAADVRRAERLNRARELFSRRDMLLAALKDLDDDHATDKMSDEDHAALKTRLSNEALVVLREIDSLDLEAEDPPQLRLMQPEGGSKPGGTPGTD